MPRRATIALLALGGIAVVFAALPYRVFELDRFFVPKELVLHVVALAVAALLLARRRSGGTDLVDALLAFFLGWSVLSVLFATNHWLAQRALAVSVSSAVLFWGARRLATNGGYRAVLAVVALATVCAVATGLAQAYGLESDYFSQNRAPGGTFGNRNFVAHIAVIGTPALIYVTTTTTRTSVAFAGTIGSGLVAAMLVLSRTRAAWLAAAVSLVVLALLHLLARRYWREGPVGGRLARIALTGVVAIAAAVVFPNTLNWRSESPYLESALAVADYSSGSGRGRVAQYRNSLHMAAADPVFGAGPGNWPVKYVRVAPASDRSLTGDGMTANPWPSSDWMAFLSERGAVPTLALLGLIGALFIGALRHWRASGDRDVVLAKVALAGTVTATMIVSAFDAVLLLAAPSMLAWPVFGATSGIGRASSREPVNARWWAPATIALLVVTIVSVARSAAQTAAIVAVKEGAWRAGWASAARWDPGSYRIALRSAELHANRGQCAPARAHARRALQLFPHARAPKRIIDRCGDR